MRRDAQALGRGLQAVFILVGLLTFLVGGATLFRPGALLDRIDQMEKRRLLIDHNLTGI